MTLEFYTPRSPDAVRVYVKARNLVFNRAAAERFLTGVARVRLAWDAEPPVRIVMVPETAATAETLAVYRPKDGRASVSIAGFLGRFPAARSLIGKPVRVTHGVEGLTLRPMTAVLPDAPPETTPATPPETTPATPPETTPVLAEDQKQVFRCARCGTHLASWEYCYKGVGHPKRCRACGSERFEPFVITLKRRRAKQGAAAEKSARPVTTSDLTAVDQAIAQRQAVPTGMRHTVIFECAACGAEYATHVLKCTHCPGGGTIRRQIVARRLDVGPMAANG